MAPFSHQEVVGGLFCLFGLQWYKIIVVCLLNFPTYCWVCQTLLCRGQCYLFCPPWSQEQVSPALLSALLTSLELRALL